MTSTITPTDEQVTVVEDDTYEFAHGTVMILAWIVFASTAILFARYGRTIRIGSKDTFLGEKIWFQVHRTVALLATVLTLLGFFFILVQTQSEWVESDEYYRFVHSTLGGIIVCCALVQAWMALFRCHPDGKFRFIYNWLHRLTGLLAFFLSVPTIFIIIADFSTNRSGMIIILSIWSAWVVFLVIVLEVVQCFLQRSLKQIEMKKTPELYYLRQPPFVKSDTNAANNNLSVMTPWHYVTLILFLLHFLVSIALAIPLIIIIWQQ
ncbi:unnamed protein product [Rotaria magnacalcarata]|uniref:Cytochrome b561 domain-containing protein n=1 Tax=Rotaria magnacalcarata TaxID=392030 RepID=A0A816N2L9_9BILA|nr:unnamed protein product [Rotaria magnacalcarata]CAF2105055.1 unnamed protein product [Rotaria magnacalcarata]CAF3905752.1 unnamed protein product [Rotaria magnacalcarata]CAF4100813.1 unnamed protein product [Rotaria magnacalcarata]